jgi:2-iminobutanoate/2-iminopropanoate deaminase
MRRRNFIWLLGGFLAAARRNVWAAINIRSNHMKKAIKTDKAPKAIGPYSQGIIAGSLIFVSGQIPLDPASGEIVGQTIEEQAHQVFKNLQAILQAAGSSFDAVVKATVFLSDMNDFSRMNAVYAQYFSEPYPSRLLSR